MLADFLLLDFSGAQRNRYDRFARSLRQLVFGEQFSSEGQAGLFVNRADGDILHGRVSQNPDITVFRVDGSGTVFANGGFQPSGADFAESMAVAGDRSKYVAADLLVIDPTSNRRLALAQ